MKKLIFLSILFPLVVFASCNKDDDKDDYASTIVGNWEFLGKIATVETNDASATEKIRKKLEEPTSSDIGEVMTFTADNKVKRNGIEVGTYVVNGKQLTVTEYSSLIPNTVEIYVMDSRLSIIQDLAEYYQRELPYFGINNNSGVVINKLIFSKEYTRK